MRGALRLLQCEAGNLNFIWNLFWQHSSSCGSLALSVLFCPRDTEILITQSVPFESLNVDVGGENSAEEVVLIKNSPQSSTSPEAMKYANHMHHARTQQQQPQGALMFIV